MALTPRSFEQHALRPVDRMTIADLLLLGGYDSTDLLAEVLGLLFDALDSGLISINLSPPRFSRVSKDLQLERNVLARSDFLAKYKKGDYTPIVATAPEIDKPLVLLESGGQYRLYFQKYFYHEFHLKKRMKTFRSAVVASPSDNTAQLIQTLYEPGRALRKGEEKSLLAKDANQVAAIERALNEQLTIISGGPGTGKTTVVVNLLRCLAKSGIVPERILLAAPTGRAAQRMTETLKTLLQSISKPIPEDIALQAVQAQTLHTALGYRHPGQFRYSSNNLLPKDVVIMDEASMVDVVLMSQFVSALDPSTTRLVLLGDPDQLPAVAAGSIFARLTSFSQHDTTSSDFHVVLEQGYRSGSELTRLAQQIRQGVFPDHQPGTIEDAFSNKPSKSWSRLAPADIKNWPTALKAWARFYQAAFDQVSRDALDHLCQRSVAAFSQPDQTLWEIAAKLLVNTTMTRILTLVRKGPWGCEDINGFLIPLLANGLDQGGHPDTGLFAGMPIMITRNDSERGLYNGDVGIVVALIEGYYAVFQTSERFLVLPVGQLAAWEPALAATVHKSQGSEYKQVFLVLPDDPSHRLLSREMIYTAVTRAQKKLVIWADADVLQAAVSQRAMRPLDRAII